MVSLIAVALGTLKSYASPGLLAALVAASLFAALQSHRLSTAKVTISHLTETTSHLQQRIASDSSLIAARDVLIKRQNDAVRSMKTEADLNRKVYQSRITEAARVATVHKDRATYIMGLQLRTDDAMARCDAALALIEETISNEK